MPYCLRSPNQYIQGSGLLRELYPHLSPFGSRALFLISPSGQKRHQADLVSSLDAAGFSYRFEPFSSECCAEEIRRLGTLVRSGGWNLIVGVGGGKILDTVKAVGHSTGLPVAILPTVASTDAPCSALSVLYHRDGTFDRYLFLPRSPELVLVDTDVIAHAPAHLLAAGMGDALSTYFEARAVRRSGADNQVSAKPTEAAFALASRCYELLLEYGPDAMQAVQSHTVTPALEHIIEANIYLSGVGFESGGLAAAHALQKGLTLLPELHEKTHGEKVAFSTLVQLCLEQAPAYELQTVLDFCHAVGLPTCFRDLGAEAVPAERWENAAAFTCRPGMTIHHLPFPVTEETLLAAIYRANEIGQH
ncbi:MAG: glycerol dehydrogenase [Eubacteriales bacterium]|nr:glycerol dehydrogenase [Eubacteriales bacterium]